MSNKSRVIVQRCLDNYIECSFVLGEVKLVNKSKFRQALRCKVNSMKFNSSKPEYFVGKI